MGAIQSFRLILLNTMVLLIGFSNISYGAYCSTPSSTVAITPTTTAQQSASYNSGKRAFSFTATAGCTYYFETCGYSTADTYLRLYSGLGTTLLASGDDNCGLQSAITWTCSSSGTYSVLLTKSSCANLNSATRLNYYIASCVAPYDPCASITSIPTCGTSVTASMSGTGAGWSPSSCGYSTPGQEKLFSFTPSASGNYSINVTAISGGYIDFFWKDASSGCNATGWNCIQDIVSTGTYYGGTSISLTAGVTYYFLLDPEGSGSYSATFSIGCPAAAVSNDICSSATPITCGQTLSGTTIGATSTGETTLNGGTCGTSITQAGVWYVVTGTGQDVLASLCGTSWDSKISVFSGSCGALTCIGGIDDNGPACTGLSASYSFSTVAGTAYYILVHGYSSDSNFDLTLSCSTPDPLSAAVSSPACTNGSISLSVTGQVGTVDWYTGSCGGTYIGSGNPFSTVITGATTYYARNNAGSVLSSGCASVSVSPNAIPSAPMVTGSSICYGATGPVSSSSTVSWYNASSGGTLLGTGTSYTSGSLTSTTTIYAEENVGGCLSSRSAAVIAVNPLPSSIASTNCSSTGCYIADANNWVLMPNPANELVASVYDASGGNALGNTMADVLINTSVQSFNGMPYLQRVITITPTSNGPAQVKLYFTNAEFAALQAADPSLNSISQLGVTKFAGPGLSGASVYVAPSQITANTPYAGVNEITITVTGFSTFVIHRNVNATPLAIHLASFDARPVTDHVSIEWVTASEENNDFFLIERSEDGISFERILEHDGAGNSNHTLHYAMDDNSPLTGWSYYRLRQVDYDGHSTVSQVKAVYFDPSENDITVYPNPAISGSVVQIKGSYSGSIEIFSMSGQLVKSIQNSSSISTEDLTPGVYFVRFGGNGAAKKLIIE
ncbi:MAG: T9SS type A sorting domain-containing protein [Flavobacteriales bacterium]|nr:T9SS type A sorting domain-containing protein [Flavobacteriales bacterium]